MPPDIVDRWQLLKKHYQQARAASGNQREALLDSLEQRHPRLTQELRVMLDQPDPGEEIVHRVINTSILDYLADGTNDDPATRKLLEIIQRLRRSGGVSSADE